MAGDSTSPLWETAVGHRTPGVLEPSVPKPLLDEACPAETGGSGGAAPVEPGENDVDAIDDEIPDENDDTEAWLWSNRDDRADEYEDAEGWLYSLRCRLPKLLTLLGLDGCMTGLGVCSAAAFVVARGVVQLSPPLLLLLLLLLVVLLPLLLLLLPLLLLPLPLPSELG